MEAAADYAVNPHTGNPDRYLSNPHGAIPVSRSRRTPIPDGLSVCADVFVVQSDGLND